MPPGSMLAHPLGPAAVQEPRPPEDHRGFRIKRCARSSPAANSLRPESKVTRTPFRFIASRSSKASVHCRCPRSRAASGFSSAATSRSSGQNSCPLWLVTSVKRASALAALTAPCVRAGLVSRRSTPSCVIGLEDQARRPGSANHDCATVWNSWRGQTSAKRTFTSGKCRFILRPIFPAPDPL